MKKERKKRLSRLAERKTRRRAAKMTATVPGILKMTASGYGFVVPRKGEHFSGPLEDDTEIFIPPKFDNGAIDGDEVMVEILPARPGRDDGRKGPCGRVIEILRHRRSDFVGELLSGNRVRPLNNRLPAEIRLTGAHRGAVRGDWLKLRLFQGKDGVWRAAAAKVLGPAGVIASDLDAVMCEYELPPRYSADDDAAALTIVPREIEREDHRTDLTVITLDPVDAKDFDDALSVTDGEAPGTAVVGVHISDVAACIAPNSRFDAAAAQRGFSCYLPGRTLPMLPPGLTAKISLHTGTDSLAHSVFLTIDEKTGEILARRRCHTRIRIARRLDYDGVQAFLDSGSAPAEWSSADTATIRRLAALSALLRRRRAEVENFIELPLPEVRVLCDEKTNRNSGLESRLSRPSEQLVEEFMLAANSAVGEEMRAAGIAGIYRVHPEPEPEKSMEFSELMEQSFHLSPGDIADRKGCNRFIASLPDDPRRNVILGMLLRSMARAGYSAKGDLHYALGKVNYCHFTSPIRRYTDLTVHQQLWNYDRKVRTRRSATMERIASAMSECEERCDNATNAANDRLKLRYLENRLEAGDLDMLEGVIIKVINAGLQVAVGELGIFGFVPAEQLRGSFSRTRYGLRESKGRREYKVGDYIYLRLARIDFGRNSAIFVPAGR